MGGGQRYLADAADGGDSDWAPITGRRAVWGENRREDDCEGWTYQPLDSAIPTDDEFKTNL